MIKRLFIISIFATVLALPAFVTEAECEKRLIRVETVCDVLELDKLDLKPLDVEVIAIPSSVDDAMTAVVALKKFTSEDGIVCLKDISVRTSTDSTNNVSPHVIVTIAKALSKAALKAVGTLVGHMA